MAALSQLSYGPKPPQCSRELVVLRPANPLRLVVSGRGNTQLKRGASRYVTERDQVAAPDIAAVDGERVHVIGAVELPEKPVRVTSVSIALHIDDVSYETTPLALDSDQVRPKIENQVVTKVDERTRDRNIKFERRKDDRRLCNRTLLIRREHTPKVTDVPDVLLSVQATSADTSTNGTSPHSSSSL
jgi:hypothetical protein